MGKRPARVVFDEWETYVRDSENGPFFISFDAEAEREDLTKPLPFCARVLIPIHEPNQNGGPVSPESEQLWDMEDGLCAALAEHRVDCRLVGRVTHNGIRELVFQLSDWESFRPPVGLWMGEHDDYEIDVSEHEGWEFFNDIIRPSAEDRLFMADQGVVNNLVKAGSDPEKEHGIEYVFHGEQDGLKKVAHALQARGYTAMQPLDFKSGECVMVKRMTLDVYEIFSESLANGQTAEEFGARCDGWGAEVVR